MKKKSRQRGFTLIEMIFVLAIIITLVAIFVPLAVNKLSDANLAKADSDLATLAASMTAFFSDVGIWPASNGGTPNADNLVLRTLLVGDPVAGVTPNTIASPNPTLAGGVTYFTTGVTGISSGTVPVAPEATINNAFNHLVANNPNANATEGSRPDGDYRTAGTKRWRGPYVSKLGADPWGNNYVINIGAIASGIPSVGATERGWMLSAGPDGTLQTAATSAALSNDDRGFIFCTRC
jgi:prepilin-type N-terminal cleavage/methylation domain-containing protein